MSDFAKSALVLVPSLARTVTERFGPFRNAAGASGVAICFDSTAIVDTPTITPSLQFCAPDGTFHDWITFTNITAVAVAKYAVQGSPAPAGLVGAWGVAIHARLPGVFYLNMVHADADSITYNVWAVPLF